MGRPTIQHTPEEAERARKSRVRVIEARAKEVVQQIQYIHSLHPELCDGPGCICKN